MKPLAQRVAQAIAPLQGPNRTFEGILARCSPLECSAKIVIFPGAVHLPLCKQIARQIVLHPRLPIRERARLRRAWDLQAMGLPSHLVEAGTNEFMAEVDAWVQPWRDYLAEKATRQTSDGDHGGHAA